MSTVDLDYKLKKKIDSPVHQGILYCVAAGINKSQELTEYLNLFTPYRLEESVSDLIASGLLTVDNVTLSLIPTTAYLALKKQCTNSSVLKSKQHATFFSSMGGVMKLIMGSMIESNAQSHEQKVINESELLNILNLPNHATDQITIKKDEKQMCQILKIFDIEPDSIVKNIQELTLTFDKEEKS